MRIKAHHGNEVSIATNLKLRVVKYEYICHFYSFYKATILQLNLTIQRHSYGRVGNSPPLRQTMFLNIILGAFGTIYKRGIIIRRSPSLKPERQKYHLLFVLGICEYNCGGAKPFHPCFIFDKIGRGTAILSSFFIKHRFKRAIYFIFDLVQRSGGGQFQPRFVFC